MITKYMAKVVADARASAEEYARFSRLGVSTHPIPFFGDVEAANVITVGVNPSATEFENRAWPSELSNRELTDRLRRYFVSAPAPPHPWFATWSKALAHLGVSYRCDAAHLDLSPRATVAMGAISDWQGFAKMVKRDARWFFELLSMRKTPQAILIAGCVTKRWYIHEFIECIAPNYGYQLIGEAETSGIGRVGFLHLIGTPGEVPVFFCSVSPSAENREMLVERVHKHRITIANWLGVRRPLPHKSSPDCRAASKTTFALGIDLGGSSIKAVAVTPEGKLLGETNVQFDVNEQFDWARRIQHIVHEIDSKQGCRAQAIGISAPGLAAADGRSIAVMPGRLSGLEGLNWTEFLNTPQPVPVLNDAHAALLGESWLGAARGFQNVFMLTLGTGVGGAAMVDGKLLKGAVSRAGHLGHVSLDVDGPRDVCGMPGSLEVMIGNCTIEQRTGGRFKTTHELVEAHLRGDKNATGVWLKSVRALGCAISSLVNVLDPEAVIIGGGIARSGAALFEPLERFVRDTEWNVGTPVKILPAQLGELAGAYGAAWKALNAR